jgi:hypothetical protein
LATVIVSHNQKKKSPLPSELPVVVAIVLSDNWQTGRTAHVLFDMRQIAFVEPGLLEEINSPPVVREADPEPVLVIEYLLSLYSNVLVIFIFGAAETVCHVAAVSLVATNACHATGAVAAETLTVVVADLRAEA